MGQAIGERTGIDGPARFLELVRPHQFLEEHQVVNRLAGFGPRFHRRVNHPVGVVREIAWSNERRNCREGLVIEQDSAQGGPLDFRAGGKAASNQ